MQSRSPVLKHNKDGCALTQMNNFNFQIYSFYSPAPEESKSAITKPVSAAKVKVLFTWFTVSAERSLGVLTAYYLFIYFKTPPPKCQDCRQYLDDSDLKFFQGDPDTAVRILHPANFKICKCAKSVFEGLLCFSSHMSLSTLR